MVSWLCDSGWLSELATGWLAILLDATIKGSVLVALAAVAALVMRRRSAAMRHLVWALTMVGLVAMPVLSGLLPRWHVLPDWLDTQAALTQTGRGMVEPEPAPTFPLPGDYLAAPVGPIPASPSVPPGVTAMSAGASDGNVEAKTDAWVFVSMLWLLGVLVGVAPVVAGVVSLRRLVRASQRVTDGVWLTLLTELRVRLGVGRMVTMLRAAGDIMPMAWGLLRPVVILPQQANGWPSERRRVVLLHELAHIRRLDCLTQMIGRFARAVYWFNPLVWWAYRRLIGERERACDDLVLRAGSKPSAYAEHLLAVVSALPSRSAAGRAAIAMARRSNIEGRLLAILDARISRRALTRLAVCLAVAALTCIALPVAMLQPAVVGQAERSNAASDDEPNATGRASVTTATGMHVTTDRSSGESKVTDTPGAPDGNQLVGAMVGTWWFENPMGDEEQMVIFADARVVMLGGNGHHDLTRLDNGLFELREYGAGKKNRLYLLPDGQTLVQTSEAAEGLAKIWRRIDVRPHTRPLRPLSPPASSQSAVTTQPGAESSGAPGRALSFADSDSQVAGHESVGSRNASDGDAKGRLASNQAVSASNLRAIGNACLVYASAHDEQFAPDLQTLVDDGFIVPKQLHAPYDPTEKISYRYVPGQGTKSDPGNVLAYERPGIRKDGKKVVSFASTMVTVLSDSKFRTALAETQRRLALAEKEAAKARQAAGPTTRPGKPGEPEAVTLRLIDPQGRPVLNGEAGRHGRFRSAMGRGWNVGFPGGVADEEGKVVLAADELFRNARPGEPVGVYALHEARQLASFVELSREAIGRQIDVSLEPACRVQGKLNSAKLTELGRSLSWINVVMSWNGHPSLSRNSLGQQFEFILPPGQYKLYAYGTDTYSVDRDVEIKPGQRELELTIDLPASRLAHLFGKAAPELTRIKGWKNGGPVKLADLRGKLVLLDFWGYWCGPCIQAMPKLMELHDAYAEKGLVIIAIHDDSVASIEDMDDRLARTRKEHWGGRDLPFLVALDGGGRTPVEGSDRQASGATTAAYGIFSFPTAVLIGRDGTVLEKFHPQDPNAVARLERLLGVQPSPDGKTATGGDEPAPWRQRFDAVYRLEPGEVIKRIAPPFIPERKQYYVATLSHQAEVLPDPPDYFMFLWDGTLSLPGYGFCGKVTLTRVLSALGIGRNEYEAPPELLKLTVPGDWIVRKTASKSERLTALEAILKDQLGASIRFQQRQGTRPVIVARGSFQFRSLSERATYDPDMVHVFADVLDADESYGGSRGTVAQFLVEVGATLNVTVVDETEPSPDTLLAWGTHSSCQLKQMPEGAQKWAKVDLILENLTKQTSLELAKQERVVDLWLVTRQSDN